MSDRPAPTPLSPVAGAQVRRLADPERLRLAVAWVLTVGVAISAALLIVSVIGAVLVGWDGSLIGRPPAVEPVFTLAGLLAGLAVLQPAAIGQLGLLVLVLTPILRVLTSLILFAVERDRVYVAVSLGVLAILLASLLVVR